MNLVGERLSAAAGCSWRRAGLPRVGNQRILGVVVGDVEDLAPPLWSRFRDLRECGRVV